MENHYTLIIDQLPTESNSPASSQSDPLSQNRNLPENIQIQYLKIEECRICHEDDLEFNLEVPCSCCGSLKYAHRKCVQRWCDEKGDTICEICLQPFKPDYIAPPKLLHYGSMPMAFRGNWGISGRSLRTPHFIPMVASDDDFVDDDYDDHHASNIRSIAFCRSVAVLLSLLVVLSHTLPIFMSFGDEWWYSVAEILIMVMRAMGILLPIIIMTRVIVVFHRRRRQQIWE